MNSNITIFCKKVPDKLKNIFFFIQTFIISMEFYIMFRKVYLFNLLSNCKKAQKIMHQYNKKGKELLKTKNNFKIIIKLLKN